jgi:hypothetical protein
MEYKLLFSKKDFDDYLEDIKGHCINRYIISKELPKEYPCYIIIHRDFNQHKGNEIIKYIFIYPKNDFDSIILNN